MTYKYLRTMWDSVENQNVAISPKELKGKYIQSGEKDVQKILKLIDSIEYDCLHYTVDIKNKTVIDFGCGNGRMTIPASVYFKTVYAMDFSKNMLDAMPEIPNIVKYHVPDARRMNLKLKADYLFSISVFIHNNYQDSVRILKSLAGSMKRGGLMFLEIPIYDKKRVPDMWIDVGVWTKEMFCDAAGYAGCEVIKCYTNAGEFHYDKIGRNHSRLQVLKVL